MPKEIDFPTSEDWGGFYQQDGKVPGQKTAIRPHLSGKRGSPEHTKRALRLLAHLGVGPLAKTRKR